MSDVVCNLTVVQDNYSINVTEISGVTNVALTVEQQEVVVANVVVGGVGPQGEQGVPGNDGHTPTLTWVGDQIAVDGVVSGPRLTGPQGVPGAQGTAGDQHVFVQDMQPNFNGLTGIWLQTGMANDGFTIWFEDGK